MEQVTEQKQKPKRKTKTSNAVVLRYQKKTFQKYTVNFRKVEDADIIEQIEQNRQNGIGPTETTRRLFRNQKEQ